MGIATDSTQYLSERGHPIHNCKYFIDPMSVLRFRIISALSVISFSLEILTSKDHHPQYPSIGMALFVHRN